MAKKKKLEQEDREQDSFEKIEKKPDKWTRKKKFKNKKQYVEDQEDKKWN